MSENPICEPFINLPVKFDIEKLAAEFQPKKTVKDVNDDKSPTNFLHLEDKTWTVLPTFKYQLDHLKPYLSARRNVYLRRRWKHFLNYVPEKYVTINLYSSMLVNKPIPRRKSLNGQFYGVDYKLAPIPVADDPRNYSALKRSKSKKRVLTTKQSTDL